MTPELANIAFIVWRESVEALLVVGILSAWIRQQRDAGPARAWLWSGVAAGLVLSVVLGFGLAAFGEALPEEAQLGYQAAALLAAAALIVQMVVWMRRKGRTLKRNMESALGAAAGRSQWWGLFALALFAVAREGSETAIFLYGTLLAGTSAPLAERIGAAGVGLLMAGGTYALLQAGGRILSWRVFFRVSEIVLLMLAGSLVLTAANHLADLGLLPDTHGLASRAWDSSAFLSDGGTWGGMLSALTGYRARPELREVLLYAAYWVVVLWLLFSARAPADRDQALPS
ncbi:FTR1 family protein [uncultured Alsobacter sp.]|uniref:FTR1 family iron permease n=1 Tax=uncultured Alsobacter sp. TaxID=1748258 RepID=UPI0025CFE8FF|nr:FTR1 family protein [uncultured Alsobacter sp.]